jgi:hypothetical protein
MVISIQDAEMRAIINSRNNRFVNDAISKRSFVENLNDFTGVE